MDQEDQVGEMVEVDVDACKQQLAMLPNAINAASYMHTAPHPFQTSR
jgi:hypothetical protein